MAAERLNELNREFALPANTVRQAGRWIELTRDLYYDADDRFLPKGNRYHITEYRRETAAAPALPWCAYQFDRPDNRIMIPANAFKWIS